jgi:hypothetical protein
MNPTSLLLLAPAQSRRPLRLLLTRKLMGRDCRSLQSTSNRILWCLIISIHIIASSKSLAVFRRRPGAVPLLTVAYPRGVAKLLDPLELVPGETPRGQGRPHRHPGAGLQVAVRGDKESLHSGCDFLGPEDACHEGLCSAGGGGPRGLGKAGKL